MKINKIQLIIVFFLLASPALAQDTASTSKVSTFQLGEYSIEYDTSEEVSGGHVVYKKDEQIVLSVFDTNSNGKDDLWLRYNDDLVLDLEVSDSDGDGEADTFVTLDTDENVTDIKAPEFVLEEVVLPPDPNPTPKAKVEPIQKEAREVFTLDPPPTKNKFNFSIKWVVGILAIGALVFLKFRGKKTTKGK